MKKQTIEREETNRLPKAYQPPEGYTLSTTEWYDRLTKYAHAFKAAQAFIDSHVADPDITNEMCETYAKYQESIEFLNLTTSITEP